MREVFERSGRTAPTTPLPDDGVEVVIQTGHAQGMNAVAMSADGRFVLSSSWDGVVKLWDVASTREVRTFAAAGPLVQAVALDPGGSRVVVVGVFGVQVFDAADGRERRRIDAAQDATNAIVSADAGRIALTGVSTGSRTAHGGEDAVRVLDLESGATVAERPADGDDPVATSRDGRFVLLSATGASGRGRSHRLRVWDTSTGRAVDVAAADECDRGHCAVSDDGQRVAVVRRDSTVQLHEVGREGSPRTLGEPAAPAETLQASIAFDAGSRHLAVATLAAGALTGTLRIWNLAERRIAFERNAADSAVAFGAGDTLVLGQAFGGAPELYDLADGTTTALAGGSAGIADLAVAPDGRTVVAATETAGVRVWDLATGQLTRTIACGTLGGARSVAIDRAGTSLAIACIDGSAGLHTLGDGTRLHALRGADGNAFARSVVRFDASGRTLALAAQRDVSIWDVESGQRLATFTVPRVPRVDPGAGLAEAWIATFPKSVRRRLEQQRAELAASEPPPEEREDNDEGIRALAFDPSGRLLAIADDTSVSLWDPRRGTRERIVSAPGGASIGTALPAGRASPDAVLGALFEGSPSRGRRRAAAVPSTAVVRDPSSIMEIVREAAGDSVFALAFAADGQRLVASALGGGGRRLWEMPSGQRVGARPSTYVAPPRDEDAAAEMAASLAADATTMSMSLAVSPDGRQVAQGVGYEIALFDAATGTETARLRGHRAEISALAFTADGQRVVAGARDGSLRLFDLPSGREIVQLVALGAAESVAVTPDRFYRSSRRRVDGVAFRKDGELYPFEQFDVRFNRPDIVLERLGLAPAEAVAAYRAAYARRLRRLGYAADSDGADLALPRVEFVGAAVPASTPASTLPLQVRAIDDAVPLDRLNVYVNDVAVFGTGGVAVPDRRTRSHVFEVEVPLAAGRNRIQVSVANQHATESLRQTVYTRSTATAGPADIYLLTVGVSRYRASAYDLRYAAKDADDIAAAYRALAARSERYGEVHVLALADERATRDAIRAARTWLAQSRPQDLVVLFAAGHGMVDRAQNYFFGTHDIDPDDPAAAGLPYADFEALLDGIPALQKVLLLDTCFSGEIETEVPDATATLASSEAGRVTRRSFGATRGIGVVADEGAAPGLSTSSVEFQQDLFADLRRGTGAVVISSASGSEYALEGEQWRNGVFTYALLNGLENGRADANGDGAISVGELQGHVIDAVRALTNGGQNPTVRRENLDYDFIVYRR